MKDKICVYTCITGDYDNLNEIAIKNNNVDYYCFTNNKKIKSKTWNVIYIEDNELNNYYLSRKIKMLGHPLINENYDVSIWVDGAIIFDKDIMEFYEAECDTKDYSFFAFKHHSRDCLYDEINACARFKKDSIDKLKEHYKFLKKENYPKKSGLYEMTVFVKRHNDPIVKRTMNMWFDMIQEYSKRDQLSFMYCVSKTNLKIKSIDLNIWDNKYFSWKQHNSIKKMDVYRAYFGDSNNFDFHRVIDGKYEKNGEYYIANIIVPNDTDRIEFEISEEIGIYLKNIGIDSHLSAQLVFYNCSEYNNDKIFTSTPIVLIKGELKKNELLTITLNMRLCSKDQLLDLADKQKYSNVKLTGELIRKNQEINFLKNDYSILAEKYQSVINSKSWKMLEKIRSLKSKKTK